MFQKNRFGTECSVYELLIQNLFDRQLLMKTHALILQNELSRRLNKNPKYSLRSFAKALAITPSGLSEILAGKRGLSIKKAQMLLDRMDLSQDEEHLFLESVKSTKAKYKNTSSASIQDYQQMSDDLIKVVSDWYHFAILNLASLEKAKSTPAWVSKKLGISHVQARLALARLSRMDLISTDNGTLTRTSNPLKTTDGVPSKFVRKLHLDLLAKAMSSLEEVSLDKRDISSMVMAIDPANLEKGRTKIKNFRRGLSQVLEKGSKKEVYALTVSLIPLSEVNK